MIIKNLTNNTLQMRMKERIDNRREYEFSIAPGSSSEILKEYTIIDLEKYIREGKVATDTYHVQTDTEETHVDEKEETVLVEKEEASDKDSNESSSTVCDICGAEFASTRGLAAHRSKVHAS